LFGFIPDRAGAAAIFPSTAPRTIKQQRDFIRKSAMPPMNEAERIAINMIRRYGGGKPYAGF
jgi:hypothetical protein